MSEQLKKIFLIPFVLICLLIVLQQSGCALFGNSKSKTGEITYAAHIHPIITKHCTPCHRPAQITPFSLLGYSDVKMRATFIAEVINKKIMPPWPADTSYSRFLNQNVLSADEIMLVNEWIKNGMLAGDTARIKQNTELTKSIVRKPDYVFSVPEKMYILPKEVDQFVRLRVASPFDEDIFVSAFQFIPGNVHALHHAELLTHPPLDSVQNKEEDTLKMLLTYNYVGASFFRGYQFVTGWLPGTTIESYPSGVAKKLVAKDDYIFLLHYPPTPMLETDSTVLHVYKSKKADRYLESVEVHGAYDIQNGPLVIPKDTVITFYAMKTVEKDISAFAILPHAHHLCKKMVAYAITPTHDTIPLLRINNWDFNWQFTYKFPRYIKLPANTVVHFFATYDNTPNNPENPYHPPRTVSSSFNANDEMMELFILGVAYRAGDEAQPVKYEFQ